jgi:hypothetical protein
MESLEFSVLFSVVVVAWVGRMAHACAFVRQAIEKSASIGGEWAIARMQYRALCSAHVPLSSNRDQFHRLRGNRRIDSGRGQPPLYLN